MTPLSVDASISCRPAAFEDRDGAYRFFETDNPAAVFDETNPGAVHLAAFGVVAQLSGDFGDSFDIFDAFQQLGRSGALFVDTRLEITAAARFAADSPLEGAGFELAVPKDARRPRRCSFTFAPTISRGGNR
jgi:hypothetical protein